VGALCFGVPFRGSILVMLLGTPLFLLITLAVGRLISTVGKTQQRAFAGGFFYLISAFMRSGFAFPISSMPSAMPLVTYVDQLRYYLVVLRAPF